MAVEASSVSCGAIVWQCYRWDGLAATVVDSGLPPGSARGWQRFPDLKCRQWPTQSEALVWLWHEFNTVYQAMVEHFPERAHALADEYARAEQELESEACACQWDIRLPGKRHLFVAVVAVYDKPEPRRLEISLGVRGA